MAVGSQAVVQMGNGRRYRWEITSEDATCQQCGAPIGWVKTHKEKFVPVDPATLKDGLMVNLCHFDTCQKQQRRV